jgi:hypothetical protein
MVTEKKVLALRKYSGAKGKEVCRFTLKFQEQGKEEAWAQHLTGLSSAL